MQITAIRRTAPAGNGTEAGDPKPDQTYAIEDVDTALAKCAFLVIACPLTEQTRGLIDAGRLARMKADSVVINVGRARVIDEDALFAALTEKTIGGAVQEHFPALRNRFDGTHWFFE